MSDDTTPPPPPEGAVPPPPAPPSPYGAPPPAPPSYGAPPPAYGAPPPAYAAPPAGILGPPYAPWGQRLLAWLIDNGAPVVVILIAEVSGSTAFFLLVALASLGWSIYNYGVQQGTTGYTLGKGIVGIKLVDERTGQPVGTGLAIARMFVHILDSIPCYVGWLWPLWDAKKQTFADKILTQIVITAPKP